MTRARRHLGLENLEKREVFSVSLPQAAVSADIVQDGPTVVGETNMARVAMVDMTEHETNDTRATANELPLDVDTGVRLRGRLGIKDVDYFSFKVQNNAYLHLTAQSTYTRELHVSIEDAAGNQIASSTGNPGMSTVKLRSGEGYFVRIEGVAAEPTRYKVELTLADTQPVGPLASAKVFGNGGGPLGNSLKSETIVIDEVENNDTRKQAHALPLSVKQDVILHGKADGEKDTDYFEFKVADNAYLNLDMISVSGKAISMRVEDGKGNIKFETTVSAQDQFDSEAVKLTRGTYFLRVAAADEVGGKYQIHLGLERPVKSGPLAVAQADQPDDQVQPVAWVIVDAEDGSTDTETHDVVMARGAW